MHEFTSFTLAMHATQPSKHRYLPTRSSQVPNESCRSSTEQPMRLPGSTYEKNCCSGGRLSRYSFAVSLKAYPSVSHSAIYRYIDVHPSLRTHLRRRGKPYKNTAGLHYNNTNRLKHSIHDRPAAVDALTRSGDLEGDTIFGKIPKTASSRTSTEKPASSPLGSLCATTRAKYTSKPFATQRACLARMSIPLLTTMGVNSLRDSRLREH